MNRDNILSIDLGTSNSCAAVMIDGNIRLVKEPVKQSYSFPSSIYLDESGEILVGHFAETKKIKDSSRYRSEIKPDLIQEYPYILGQNGEYEFTAQQLITEILKTFKKEAEKITFALDKGKVTDVVITVPATYRKNKRDAMIEAAKNAGFVSIRLIEEPVAAAIYYHQQNPATFREGDIILIYDLGGGTFDATLIEKFDNGFQVLGQPVGIENCGGINFERAIFQHLKATCSQQLQEKLSTRGNSPEKNSLLDFCRYIKHQFSGTTEAIGHVPIDHQLYVLSRDDFNRMIDVYVEQTIVCSENLIKSAGLELQDISKILMVGGSCRIPYIQESIESRLESSVLLIDEPELAVCQGAGILQNFSLDEQIEEKTTKNKKSKGKKNMKIGNKQIDIDYHLTQGNSYLNSKNYRRAISYYKTVLYIDPNNTEALFNQGLAYFQLKKNQKAQKIWKTCISIDREYTQQRLDKFKNLNNRDYDMNFSQNIIQSIEQLLTEISNSFSQFENILQQLLFRKEENNFPPIEKTAKDIFTYEQAISYFVDYRPNNPEIKKGIILREAHQKEYLITQLFLNEFNQPVKDANNHVYGRRLKTKKIDDELDDNFGNKSAILVE